MNYEELRKTESRLAELDKEILEEIENSNNEIVKEYFAYGKGIFYVKVKNGKVVRNGLHTLYLKGTEKEYRSWINDLFNKCDSEFNVIDFGEC